MGVLGPNLAIYTSGRHKVCNVPGPGRSPCPSIVLDDLKKMRGRGMRMVEDASIAVTLDGPGRERAREASPFRMTAGIRLVASAHHSWKHSSVAGGGIGRQHQAKISCQMIRENGH